MYRPNKHVNIVEGHKCLFSNSIDLYLKYKRNLKPVICRYRLHSAWSHHIYTSEIKIIKIEHDISYFTRYLKLSSVNVSLKNVKRVFSFICIYTQHRTLYINIYIITVSVTFFVCIMLFMVLNSFCRRFNHCVLSRYSFYNPLHNPQQLFPLYKQTKVMRKYGIIIKVPKYGIRGLAKEFYLLPWNFLVVNGTVLKIGMDMH